MTMQPPPPHLFHLDNVRVQQLPVVDYLAPNVEVHLCGVQFERIRMLLPWQLAEAWV